LFPSALDCHLNNLRDHPETGMSAGGWELVNHQGWLASRQVLPPANIPLVSMLYGNPFPVHSVLVVRSWFDRCGLFDERLNACEDWDLWLRYATAGCPIRTFGVVVCVYRMHGDQMTKQAGRMRAAMLAVLERAFANPALPVELQDLREKATAAALVKAAARGYYAGQSVEASQDLSRAVQLDPSLLVDGAAPLADLFAGWAESPMVEDPLAYLARIYQGLPGSLSALKKRYRMDIARLSMQLAFNAYQRGHLSRARYYILKAAVHRPAWLANTGVLSILARSFTYSK
jgi:hypothetical protein